jgi:hypothetical protein
MSLIYSPSGEVIHESRNLRGLLDHARRVGPPVSFHLVRDVSPRVGAWQPYHVAAFYPDGSRGVSRFADKYAAAFFLAARRSWRGVKACGDSDFVARFDLLTRGRA